MTDWNLIVNVNLDDLNDEKAELLYDQLIEINPSDESNIDLLRSAFKAAKCVMQVKALQADVAVEELEEFIKKNDKNELDNLRRQVDLYRSSLVNQHGLDPMNQIKDYQNQVSELKELLEGKNSELSRAKRRTDDLERKLQLNQEEIDSLKDELDSTRVQMETRSHGDSIIETTELVEQVQDQLREKNKQITNLLNEFELMEKANEELARQVNTLKDQLTIATDELKLAADEMEETKNQYTEIQKMNEMLVIEKEYFLKENDSYRKQLDSIDEKHDNLTSQLNEKMNSLIEMIKEKDKLIEQLKGQQLTSNQGPPSLSSINEKSASLLQQESSEKNETINYLKEQLTEAVNTIQGQNELIKRLTKKGAHSSADQTEINRDAEESRKQIDELKVKLDQLEDELKIKDNELHEMTKMKLAYERGEYGLAEALNEVRVLKKQLLAKEENLTATIQELNQLSIKLNSYEDQIDIFKEMGGGLNLKLDSLDTNKILPEVTDNRLKILRLQKTIIKLEDEKISLQEKLRSLRSSSRPQSADGQESMIVDVKSKQMDDERDKILSHLKELQDENRGLQMGMKEILLGIHESNSRSDVVIDCPSLERLVNLLEGRSLSADLTTVIALKGELDLVRGQNQQLVMELKRLRHEHFKLICVYADEISAQMNSNHTHPKEIKSTVEPDYEDDDSTTISTTSTSTIVENGHNQPNRQSVDSTHELSEGEVLFSSELDQVSSDQRPIVGSTIDLRHEDIDEGNDEEDEDENTLEAEDEDAETTVDGDLDTQLEDNLDYGSTINQHDYDDDEPSPPPQPQPRKLIKLDKEIQTIELLTINVPSQTEPMVEPKCTKCSRLLVTVMDIKGHIKKLSESIIESENHYPAQNELIRKENDRLLNLIQLWEEKYNQLLMEKYNQLLTEKNELGLRNGNDQNDSKSPTDEDDEEINCQRPLDQVNIQQLNQQSAKSSSSNKAIPKVLETIIQCLQKRIDQKETAINELQALIRSTHENYEREIGKLMNEKPIISETISFDQISLNRMVQADELRSDLDKCYKELEECKQEAYHRIQCLLEQLEKEKNKSKKLQEQLDRLTGRIKSKSTKSTTINKTNHKMISSRH